MAVSTEHRLKFAALWRLHMSEKIIEWEDKLQTNKQTNNETIVGSAEHEITDD